MIVLTHVVGCVDEKAAFKAEFEELRAILNADLGKLYDLPNHAKAYLDRCMSYNVPHGKLTRGLAVPRCYASFMPNQELTPDQSKLARQLGWCVEWLQACFLVADDIMDGSITRRGQPCFFRLPEIGLKAVNDSLILQSQIYRVLWHVLRTHESYLGVIELFQEVTYTTEVGQLLDLTSQPAPGEVKLEAFDSETLHRIYRYKTAYYSFYLSVAIGMRLAGVTKPEHYDTAREICLAIGEYFQAQDDFLDCFGDPEVIGKVGTDIEENKCTWLVVQALQSPKFGADERAVLERCYGRNDPELVAEVKQLYEKLEIRARFSEYETESYGNISAMIENASKTMPTGAFTFLLQKVYKRSK